MHNEWIIEFAVALVRRVTRLFVSLVGMLRWWWLGSREGLLIWPQVIVRHIVALLIDYSEMMIRSNWPQGCANRLQVRVGVQPLRVMW